MSIMFQVRFLSKVLLGGRSINMTEKKTKNDSWQHSSAWIQTVEPVWSRNWCKRLDQLGFKHPSPELVGLVLTPELDELCAPVVHQFQNGLDGNIPVEFTGGDLNIMPWSYQQGKIWPVSLYMTSYMAQRLRLGFLEWTTEKIMVKTQRQKSPDVGYTVTHTTCLNRPSSHVSTL